jgi:hypothetical protein
LYHSPIRGCFSLENFSSTGVFPTRTPSKIPALDFIREFPYPLKISCRILSPSIAVLATASCLGRSDRCALQNDKKYRQDSKSQTFQRPSSCHGGVCNNRVETGLVYRTELSRKALNPTSHQRSVVIGITVWTPRYSCPLPYRVEEDAESATARLPFFLVNSDVTTPHVLVTPRRLGRSFPNGIHQDITRERLAQIGDAAGVHRVIARGLVVVRGHEDDRTLRSRCRKSAL